MSRRFVTSLAFVAGLFAVAVAQPPGTNKKIDPNADKADPPAAKAKKADPTDAAVSAALVNDPDVKVARAKVQLAEAELAKAKQAVVLKVLTLTASIQEYKRAVRAAEDRVAWSARMVEKGLGDQRQLLDERAKLESAQAALARAETELKLLTGGGAVTPVDTGGDIDLTGSNTLAVQLGLKWLAAQQRGEERDYAIRLHLAQLALLDAHAVKGPVPDRIRAALDKPIKLGAKGEKISFEKALEVFKKDAGLDVPVRVITKVGPVESLGEELPVGAWLQLFADQEPNARILVREYGLVVTMKDYAPPDAPALIEFWKQKPVVKKETAPEPKGR